MSARVTQYSVGQRAASARLQSAVEYSKRMHDRGLKLEKLGPVRVEMEKAVRD